MRVLFLSLLFILGACFGSFLCCQVRRLHLSPTRRKKLGSRSTCLHCSRRLKWYDNLPLISWLALKGRCRKCHKPIGLLEFLSELGLALSFLALGTTIDPTLATPLEWFTFIVLILFTLVLGFLAIYDGAYGELPTAFLILALLGGAVLLALREYSLLTTQPFSLDQIWQPLLAVSILGGLYLILYVVSHGRWVGDGDWLLGTAIALALYSPWLALIALFLANFLATLVMYPTMRHLRKHQIYFGPFLAIAFVIAYTCAGWLAQLL